MFFHHKNLPAMKTGLLLIFAALPLCLIAQGEHLFTFENSSQDVRSMHFYGDEVMYEIRRTNGHSDFYKTNLGNGQTQILLLDQRPNAGTVQYNENGVFFTNGDRPGTPTEFYLNFLSLDGTHTNFGRIGIYQYNTHSTHTPAHAAIFENKYYVHGFLGTFRVWESDATQQGTRHILQSPRPIRRIDQNGQALLIITEHQDAWQFFRYEGHDAPVLFFTMPKAAWSSDFAIVGRHENYLYFNATAANGHKAIWRTDLTSQGTEVFIEGHHARKFIFDEQGFILEAGGPWVWSISGYYKAAWHSPADLQHLRVSPEIDHNTAVFRGHLGGNYFSYRSAPYGREVIRLNQDDEFELMADMLPGPASGMAPQSTWGFENHLAASTEVYVPLTNGNDPYMHLYRIRENEVFPVMRLEDPANQKYFFLFEDWIYWFRANNGQLSLHRGLNQDTEPSQPQAPQQTETWRREVAFVDTILNENYSTTEFLRTQGIWIDQDDNVIMSIGSEWWNRRMGVSGHEGLNPTAAGANGFVKFNKYGEVQWTKVFGFNNLSWNTNPHILTIDTNGDLIVLGIHGPNFSIDGVPITAPQTFGRYVVKLDGNSGSLLWARGIGASQFEHIIESDGLITDKDNNAYAAITYRNFSIQIGHIRLTSNKSPAQAVVKLDPDGNILWAKNLENPWTDRRAYTLSLSYDPARNSKWSVQTQMGHYSSVFGRCPFDDFFNYIQEWDVDGNVLIAKQVKANDWNGITAGVALPNGDFFAAGYYRGTITLDRFFSIIPPKSSVDCQDMDSYHFILDKDTKTVSEAMVSQGQWLFPYQVKAYGNHVYMLGGQDWSRRRLTLHKFDLSGRLVGIKDVGIRQGNSPDRFEHFDVRNGYIVVATTELRNDPARGIFSLFPDALASHVFRMADADWEAPDERYRRMDLDWPFKNELIYTFPNPTDGLTHVFLKNPDAAAYQRYEVFDMQGRRVAAGPVGREQLIEIDLGNLATGTYVVRLMGPEGAATGKVVKH